MELDSVGLVGVSRSALSALRSVMFRDTGNNAAAMLQEAGYAGGAQLHEAFERWCASKGVSASSDMDADEFERRAGEFLAELGWGSVEIGTMTDAAMTLDSTNWAESDPASGMQFPGCYLSAGMLAEFFTRVAGQQLVAMEVECRSMGSSRCRFLVGSAETMQHVYEGLTRGEPYEQLVG